MQRFVTIPNSNVVSRISLQSNCHHEHYIEGALWFLGIAIKGCFWVRVFQIKWFLFLVLFPFATVFSLLVLEVAPATHRCDVFNASRWQGCLVPVPLKLWDFQGEVEPVHSWECLTPVSTHLLAVVCSWIGGFICADLTHSPPGV